MNKFSVIVKCLKEKDIDCALFLTDEHINPNIFYLTGYKGAGYLLVFAKETILHVPSRDLTEAKNMKGITISSGKKLHEVLSEKGLKFNKIAVDFANISALEINNLKEKLGREFFDLTEIMNEMRMIKGNDEVDKIRKACAITDEIIGKFIDKFSEFNTEENAAAFLVYEALKSGCDLAFEPIVASGYNAAIPHHKPQGRIMDGFCVVDFGVKYKGYCSDITRTIYFGKPNKEEEKIYEDLLKEQERIICLVKHGAVISDLYVEAEKNLKQKLIHSLGHGMGVEVHESPNINKKSKSLLKEGMVITIEPGEYVEGKYGIRIEDDVLVTSSGPEVLSKFTKKLICLYSRSIK
ncbi:MAG: Xaa-Pro peptidase family protein [Nanoarchaeota archaeon]